MGYNSLHGLSISSFGFRDSGILILEWNALKMIKKDIYTRVTDQVILGLKKGIKPWVKPWSDDYCAGQFSYPLRQSGENYKGINVIILLMSALDKNYFSPSWMTYKQSKILGGSVRKGEKGQLVVYANSIVSTEQDRKTGEDIEIKIPFLRGYTVFNVDQIDDLPKNWYKHSVKLIDLSSRVLSAEKYFNAIGANIKHGGNIACYIPSSDYIKMPLFESFNNSEAYYSVLAHELAHWTCHKKRLNREVIYTPEGIAKEELVAELSACMVMAVLGLSITVRNGHVDYLGGWLTSLQNDNKAIFRAAAQAQRIMDYFETFQTLEISGPMQAPENSLLHTATS